MSAQAPSGEHPKQEPSDLRPRAVLVAAGSVIVLVLLVALLAHLMTRVSGAAAAAPAHAPLARTPRLSSNPQDDITSFERAKRSQLQTYGWADRQHAYAHIPIERAMQKLATQESSTQESSSQRQP